MEKARVEQVATDGPASLPRSGVPASIQSLKKGATVYWISGALIFGTVLSLGKVYALVAVEMGGLTWTPRVKWSELSMSETAAWERYRNKVSTEIVGVEEQLRNLNLRLEHAEWALRKSMQAESAR